jgi:hypothetical protein
LSVKLSIKAKIKKEREKSLSACQLCKNSDETDGLNRETGRLILVDGCDFKCCIHTNRFKLCHRSTSTMHEGKRQNQYGFP